MNRNEFSPTHAMISTFITDYLQDVLGEKNQRVRRMLRTAFTDFLKANPQCTREETEKLLKEITDSAGGTIKFIHERKNLNPNDLLNELIAFYKTDDETSGDKVIRTQYLEPRFKRNIEEISAEQWKKELSELQLLIAFALDELAKVVEKVEKELA